LKANPQAYKVMLEHWLANQPANVVTRLYPFWHQGYGVKYLDEIVIKKKEYDIIKRQKRDATLEDVLARFRRKGY